MDNLDKKCPACGATISFNLENEMWECSYCASKYTFADIEKHNNMTSGEVLDKIDISNDINETSDISDAVVNVDETKDIDEASVADEISQVLANNVGSPSGIDIYHCNGCGAEMMVGVDTTVTFCVYCGSDSISKERIEQWKMPDYIIPFKITKDIAIAGLKKATKKLLIPKSFKNSKVIEKITGVYIPFWAYDLEVNGEVEFEAWDTKTRKDSNYKYIKIDRYSVRKSGHFDFDKVLVNASTRFSSKLLDLLEPFDYNELIDYNQNHLANFLLEKNDVSENDGVSSVKDKVNADAVKLMEVTVLHHNKKVINNGLRISMKKSYYIMLPVWLINIKYKEKNYVFAMNGQTGKMVGEGPIGKKEVVIWSAIFFILLFVVGFIFMWFLWG